MNRTIIILISITFILLIAARKISFCKNAVLSTVSSSLFSILTLILLNLFTDLTLPISFFSLGLATVAGLPGISAMIILNSV